MGSSLIRFYKEKICSQQKLAFQAAILAGFIVHMYKFANTLPGSDSLFNYYSSQNMVHSGRWFLSVACSFSSYFDLPWLNGVISLFFIAITAALIVDIFHIENPVLVILSSALLVSFPSITETFFYEYTADGYMMSMLLATLAVYFSTMERYSKGSLLLSSTFICLSCGIYQAYVSFALVLAICYFMNELLENTHNTKQYLLWIGRQFVIYSVGLLGYLLIWKICLSVQGSSATGYAGIAFVGQMNLHTLFRGLVQTFKSLILFFFGWNIFKNGLTWYAGLNGAFLLLTCISILCAIVHSKITQRKGHLFLFCLCVAAIPFAIFIWYFTSPTVEYYTRMEQSLCILFIFTGVLCERWLKPNKKWIATAILAAIIFNNSVIANKFYYYMDLCYERSYATALEIQTRIHMIDDGTATSVAIIGFMDDEFSDEFSRRMDGLGSLGILKFVDKNLTATGQDNLMLFLLQYTGFELAYYQSHPDIKTSEVTFPNTDIIPNGWSIEFPLASSDLSQQLAGSDEVKAMGIWPASNSVALIDNTIVIKLSSVD